MTHARAIPRHRSADEEAGFALFVALLAIVAFTVLATGGIMVSNTESEMSRNFRSGTSSFYLAQSGLSTYLGTVSGTPPDDTLGYSFSGGSAQVWATQIGDTGNGHRIWKVTSEALPDPPYENLKRRVSVLIMLDPLLWELPGAVVSADTIRKTGGSGLLSGYDETTSSDCPEGGQSGRPGVWSYFFEGNFNAASGNPPTIRTKRDPSVVETSPSDIQLNPYDSIARATGWDIPWQGVLDGSEASYDYVIDDVADFPDLASNPDEWAVIKIDQPGSPTSTPQDQVTLDDTCCSGRGLLVVEQNVKLSGDFTWDGILLVGGGLMSSGNNTIRGSIALGLNTKLPGFTLFDLGPNDLGAGTKTYQYNACHLARAGREAGKLVMIPGSWSESYSF